MKKSEKVSKIIKSLKNVKTENLKVVLKKVNSFQVLFAKTQKFNCVIKLIVKDYLEIINS